jgi:hypothetical protein
MTDSDQVKDDNELIRPVSEEHAAELMAEMTRREQQATDEGKN